MLFRMCIAVGLAVGLPAFSWSQQNEAMQREWMRQQQKAARQQGMMQQGFQQAGQQTEITGKIQSVAKGGLVVLDGANQTWRIAVLPATTVHVTGKTTAASLRSGAIVEFTAELDDKGAIRDKVASLTVTSLSEEKRMGIFPAGAAAGGGAFEGFGAGGEETPFGKPAKPAKRPAGKPASHALPAGAYRSGLPGNRQSGGVSRAARREPAAHGPGLRRASPVARAWRRSRPTQVCAEKTAQARKKERRRQRAGPRQARP